MSPLWGGPVTAVSRLVPALSRHGVHCEIATARGHRVGVDTVEIPGTPIHCFDTGLLARAWTGWSPGLAGFLAANVRRFDLVHVHELWHYPSYVACRVAQALDRACVVSIRGALDPWKLQHSRAIRKWLYLHAVQKNILNSVDAIHALTSAEAALVFRLGLDTPVFVVPNGAVPTLPSDGPADRAAFLRRYPQLSGKCVLLFLGRQHAVKGLDVLARSFVAVASRHPDAMLLVVGPDVDGAGRHLRSVLKQADVLDRAVFTGLLVGADKHAALACADLFVLTSYSEGFSNAVVEALAAGLPVVISQACNFPEVVSHEAGIVVCAADDTVVEALDTMLSDNDLRARMGRNARALIAKRYTWRAIAEKFAETYRTLARNGRH